MIFALADYLQYRLRKGPYSENVLLLKGAFLTTPEKASMLFQARDGDSIFCHPVNSFVSWIVMYVTASPWSHVGTLTSAGTVIEAITQGVVERPATCYFNRRYYVSILSISATDDQRRTIVSYLRRELGAKYNWFGVIRLGVYILFGAHSNWRVRCSVDIVLFLSLGYFLGRHLPVIRVAAILAIVAYVSVALANRLQQKRLRAQATNSR